MTEGSEFESQYSEEFPLLHIVQTGPEAHPTSYPVGARTLTPGLKFQRREADQSPTNAEVKTT
jgi:hypothetical protein